MDVKLMLFLLPILLQSAMACSITNATLDLNVLYLLTSPGFPSPYSNSTFECTYTATAPVNSRVFMYCDVVDIFYSEQCRYARFSFSPSGNGTFADSANYCGKYQALILKTTGNKFAAKFSNWNLNPYKQLGFRCYVIVIVVPVTAPTTTTKITTTTLPIRCTCGKKIVTSRIVGGTPTTVNQYPWMVALKYRTSEKPFCGGSLISSEWVLTAAHCLRVLLATDITVVLGEHNVSSTVESSYTIKRTVIKLIVHQNYNRTTMDNDIGLIKLSSPVTFNAGVSQACLPIKFGPTADFNGVTGLASGWGTVTYEGTSPTVLMHVRLPVVGTTQCRQHQSVSSKITANMICTYQPGKDTCQGDSGGPLSYLHGDRYYIIGLTSWGFGCAQVGKPGVYTKVTNYINWITTETGVTFCQQ